MAFCFVLSFLSGCGDQALEREAASKAWLNGWFEAAELGQRDDQLCHGFGLLKHPEFNCAEMLEATAQITPDSRVIETVVPQDCFAGVCGEFVELRLNSRAKSGEAVQEIALLKRDEGQFRMYWYRSDILIEQLQANQPQSGNDDKDPEQIAYDELTARYPSLYSYPPCYGVRASSSNLTGELMAMDAVDVSKVEAWAQTCGESFCFSVVGNKIAALCPNQKR